MCVICKDEIKLVDGVLDCSWCPTVTHIPIIPGLLRVCQGCASLEEIAPTPGLKDISCYKCPIRSIHGLKDFTDLDACDCRMLQSIHDLPKLKSLYCIRSPLLKSIRNVPRLKTISCGGLNQLIDFPYDTITKNSPFTYDSLPSCS